VTDRPEIFDHVLVKLNVVYDRPEQLPRKWTLYINIKTMRLSWNSVVNCTSICISIKMSVSPRN